MIVFFSSSSVYGGAEELFITLAREMQRFEIPFKVIFPRSSKQWNFIVPFVRPELLFDLLEINDLGQVIRPDDVMLMYCERCKFIARINPRILYWCVMPQLVREERSIVEKILFFPFEYLFFGQLLRRNALCFMDDTSVRNVRKELGLKVSTPSYLPVPSQASLQNRYRGREKAGNRSLVATYLGRSEELKIYPCSTLLAELLAIEDVAAVHIITDDADHFRAMMREQGLDSDVIRYHEGLYGDALSDFLAETSDLHFAMGTSALNAAGLGIPTILVDAFWDPAFGVHAGYRWVFDIKNYVLGEVLTSKNCKTTGRSLSTLMSELRENQTAISEQCQDYVRQHHDPTLVCRAFVEAAERSRARYRCIFWINLIYRLKAILRAWVFR